MLEPTLIRAPRLFGNWLAAAERLGEQQEVTPIMLSNGNVYLRLAEHPRRKIRGGLLIGLSLLLPLSVLTMGLSAAPVVKPTRIVSHASSLPTFATEQPCADPAGDFEAFMATHADWKLESDVNLGAVREVEVQPSCSDQVLKLRLSLFGKLWRIDKVTDSNESVTLSK